MAYHFFCRGERTADKCDKSWSDMSGHDKSQWRCLYLFHLLCKEFQNPTPSHFNIEKVWQNLTELHLGGQLAFYWIMKSVHCIAPSPCAFPFDSFNRFYMFYSIQGEVNTYPLKQSSRKLELKIYQHLALKRTSMIVSRGELSHILQFKFLNVSERLVNLMTTNTLSGSLGSL